MITRSFLIALVILLALTPSLSSEVSASGEIGETTTRISGEDGGLDPSISSDGRFIAFLSNGLKVHDRQTGITEHIVDSASDVSISGNGRYVAFPTNGLAGDSTIFEDIYVYDRLTGIIELVSIADNGTQANDHSVMEELGTISADGRFVVFSSPASNLVPGDDNGAPDIFVRDRQAATTIRVSAATNGSVGPAVISANGGYVAFRSPGGVGIFVYDLQTNVTEQIDGIAQEQMIFSHDGRYIAFVSTIDDTAIGDLNGLPDVYLHDRLTHTTERVSIDAESDGYFLGGVSADGRYVAFTPNERNIILRDCVAGETILVQGDGAELALSDSGRYIAFEAEGLNMLAGIYLRDLAITETLVGNLDPGGTVTSDEEGDGATAIDNVETTITSPNPGAFSIEESPTESAPPSGFTFLDFQIDINAPAGTAENPLILVFRLDVSIIPIGKDQTNISVFKNGVLVSSCTGASGTASPDPCLLNTSVLADGDAEFTILTSSASTWNFGFRAKYVFSGFFPPVDNPPVFNAVKSGRAIPVKFSLGGNHSLDIFDTGYPKAHLLDCVSSTLLNVIEETVTAGSSSLSYNASTDQYTYVWKTSKSWDGTCRRLILRLNDNSEHVANFRFIK